MDSSRFIGEAVERLAAERAETPQAAPQAQPPPVPTEEDRERVKEKER